MTRIEQTKLASWKWGAKRLSRGHGEAGFTLIELLVVMLILGILAAIALPAFFNQKDKASDASAKEYAHTAEVAIETYATEHGGSYVNAGEGEAAPLKRIEPTLNSAEIEVPVEEAQKYEIVSRSSTGNEFKIVDNRGALSFTCSTEEKGGCPKGGDWGRG